MKYLIVDDEPIAHEIIEDYAQNFPQLHLAKNCYNVFQANDYLQSQQVDLIFLDINMPKMSGFEFLKSLSNPPKIIVTTAYQEYALEGYELDIIDYLLKPFSLDRFLKAVNKAVKLQGSSQALISEKAPTNKILLKDGKKIYQIAIDDILFIEAFGNYTKVHTEDKVIMTLQKLGTYIDILPREDFVQIHKSYIVALSKVNLIEANKVSIQHHKIPIGITYKQGFFERLK